ncbi:MAG: hypothetical protein QG562_23 [Patescibacteria group bacterium]|nr:hypothetical protein [Patescibacteria group bacterium]
MIRHEPFGIYLRVSPETNTTLSTISDSVRTHCDDILMPHFPKGIYAMTLARLGKVEEAQNRNTRCLPINSILRMMLDEMPDEFRLLCMGEHAVEAAIDSKSTKTLNFNIKPTTDLVETVEAFKGIFINAGLDHTVFTGFNHLHISLGSYRRYHKRKTRDKAVRHAQEKASKLFRGSVSGIALRGLTIGSSYTNSHPDFVKAMQELQ